MIQKTLLFIGTLFFCCTAMADEYPSLRAVLDSQSGNAVIDIPKGTYILDLVSVRTPYSFNGKKNVAINGNGSTVICNRQSQAFNFVNCENVTFSDLYIEYDPPCSTQGTITAISGATWDIEIHEGYPVDHLATGRVQVYGKDTRELVRNYTTTSGNSLTKTGDRTLRLVVNNPSPSVSPGDFVALDVVAEGNTSAHTIILNSCKHMRLNNIVVYDSNCFSFLEYDCEATRYYRCQVTRKTDDPKYSVQRLRAGIADGIHSKFAKIGPTIEECTIEHSGDDCIAINGNFYPVYRVDEAEKCIYLLTTSSSLSEVRIKTADHVVCVNNNGTVRGKALAEEVGRAVPSPTRTEIDGCFGKLTSVVSSGDYRYGVKVKLDDWIEGTNVGDILYSNDRIGSGFKVINNRVGHNRSRAILIKASDGIISGNTIEGSGMSGIALAPEFYWMEAGCSSNVEIAGNTIRNCMFDANMNWTSQAGALVVVAQAPNGAIASPGTFDRIFIHDNVIEGCPRPCVMLTSIKTAYYYDNTIVPDLDMVRTHGRDFGVTNNRDVFQIRNGRIYTEAPDGLTEQASENEKRVGTGENGTLSFPGLPEGKTARISVYDLTGKTVYAGAVTDRGTVSLSFLAKGIYFLSVRCDEIAFSRKVLIK